MGDNVEDGGPFKTIQRITGKLSQKLRAYKNQDDNGMDSQDIKYVINMVLSALDLENLDEDDKEDILSKFEESDMYGEESPENLDFGGEEDMGFNDEDGMVDDGMPDDGMPDDGMPDDGMGDLSPKMEGRYSESKIDRVLEKYFKIGNNEKPTLIEKKQKQYLKNRMTNIKVKSELKVMSESYDQLNESIFLLENGGKFIGKTNKNNLLFSQNGNQIKVDIFGNRL
jgi:hypothetical protein